MRAIDADALKKDIEENSIVLEGVQAIEVDCAKALIDNASAVEPRIEYGTDGQPYRMSITGGQVVPDVLQGWRYEERPGEWIFDPDFTAFGNPYGTYKCDKCGGHSTDKYPFCFWCGAKMCGGEK